MKLRGCPESSAPAPSSSSSILWPAGAPGCLERGERRPSEEVSSRNRGVPEGAHLGGSRAQAEPPGGPVQPSSPSPQGHAARGAPGRREAPPGASPASPGPLGPPGPASRLPLTLFRLLRFAPRLRSPDLELPSAKRPREGKRKGGLRAGGPGRGAPSSSAAAGAGSKGSALSRLRASDGGGRGGGISLGVGLEGVGAGSFLRPAAGSRSGRGGETVGGRPGRGWRRRCRRRSRRGGCRCRSSRRRHCLLLRPRRGASKRKRRRGARRTPQLDPSLQLQASAPPLPCQPRSQSLCAFGPEPRVHWPAAVAVRAGAPGERTTAGIRFPPQSPGPPLSLPLALGRFLKAEAN